MSILLYCRPGFERDCALEFAARAEAFGGTAKPQFGTGSGYVEATLEASHALPGELLAVQELVFARQAAQIVARVAPLPERDRAAPLIEAAREARIRAHRLLLETPDTNEGKTLSGFTRPS